MNVDKLKQARELIEQVYGWRDPAEAAKAPAGSQMGDWRDGLKLLDEAILELEALPEPEKR